MKKKYHGEILFWKFWKFFRIVQKNRKFSKSKIFKIFFNGVNCFKKSHFFENFHGFHYVLSNFTNSDPPLGPNIRFSKNSFASKKKNYNFF